MGRVVGGLGWEGRGLEGGRVRGAGAPSLDRAPARATADNRSHPRPPPPPPPQRAGPLRALWGRLGRLPCGGRVWRRRILRDPPEILSRLQTGAARSLCPRAPPCGRWGGAGGQARAGPARCAGLGGGRPHPEPHKAPRPSAARYTPSATSTWTLFSPSYANPPIPIPQIYPYHLAHFVARVLRCPPSRYYADVLAAGLAAGEAYDRLPNFTARERLRVDLEGWGGWGV